MRIGILALGACVLTACGGGGDGLSQTQATFESLYLSPNALYSSASNLPFSGVPVAGSIYYFYDTATSLSKSPSTGAQRVIEATRTDLTHTPLGLPPSQTGTWYLVDGGFYKPGSPFTHEISYSNGEVVDTPLSEDLMHRLPSVASTKMTVTPLTGPLVSAASQTTSFLSDAIYRNPALTKPGAVWGAGASCVTSTTRFTNDVYYVYDPSTPMASNTTIANLIAQNKLFGPNIIYGTDDGTVTTVQGVKVYTGKNAIPQPVPLNKIPAFYAAFYELNNNVYAGQQVKAGSVVTGCSGYNAQARASIQAALTF